MLFFQASVKYSKAFQVFPPLAKFDFAQNFIAFATTFFPFETSWKTPTPKHPLLTVPSLFVFHLAFPIFLQCEAMLGKKLIYQLKSSISVVKRFLLVYHLKTGDIGLLQSFPSNQIFKERRFKFFPPSLLKFPQHELIFQAPVKYSKAIRHFFLSEIKDLMK